MKGDDYEHSNDDKVQLEDCILAIQDGRDGCNIERAANGFVVMSKRTETHESKEAPN